MSVMSESESVNRPESVLLLSFGEGIDMGSIYIGRCCKPVIPKRALWMTWPSVTTKPTAALVDDAVGFPPTIIGKSIVPVQLQIECIFVGFLISNGSLCVFGLVHYFSSGKVSYYLKSANSAMVCPTVLDDERSRESRFGDTGSRW